MTPFPLVSPRFPSRFPSIWTTSDGIANSLFSVVSLQLGYSIATSVIEGICCYLVKKRMGITGARWGLNGAEAILKIRSLKISRYYNTIANWGFYENNQDHRYHSLLYENPAIFKLSS